MESQVFRDVTLVLNFEWVPLAGLSRQASRRGLDLSWLNSFGFNLALNEREISNNDEWFIATLIYLNDCCGKWIESLMQVKDMGRSPTFPGHSGYALQAIRDTHFSLKMNEQHFEH